MKRFIDTALVNEVVDKAAKVESATYYLAEAVVPNSGDPAGPQGRCFYSGKASANDLLRETLDLLDGTLVMLKEIADNEFNFICHSDPPGIHPNPLDDPFINGQPGNSVTD